MTSNKPQESPILVKVLTYLSHGYVWAFFDNESLHNDLPKDNPCVLQVKFDVTEIDSARCLISLGRILDH